VDRLAEVVAFRERLVPYMDLVLENRPYGSIPITDVDPGVLTRLRTEQLWLSQTYGRLLKVIHPSGTAQGMAMGYGTIRTSHDVIADAIHNPGDIYYRDLARLADQHLTMRIGQLQGEAERRRIGPDTLYRLTSVAFWLGRLWALIRWLWGSWSRRVATVIAAVILAIIGGVASGWAQAIFAQP
jgi:hypothetical protein